MTIRSQAVLNDVKNKPRRHLGYGYYKSVLTPAKRSTSEKDDRGFASTPEPLPRFEGQENCTFTVKVPSIYLGDVSRAEITSRRAVYGTNVYTDDSDVIAACIHQGWFRGAWNKDVDVALLDLEIRGAVNGALTSKDYENDILTEPPPRGPMHVPKKKDLNVTILVLPPLEKYASTTRFGIKSREWGGRHDGYRGVHDGLSFMILSIQWVARIDNNEGRSGRLRRKKMAEVLDDAELEVEQGWGDLLLNVDETKRPEVHAKESFERGREGSDEAMTSNIKGLGTKSWWKKPTKALNKTDVKPGFEREVDKEMEIAKVTERMIENANASSAPHILVDDDDLPAEKSVDEVTAAA